MSSDRDYNFNPSPRELQEAYDREKAQQRQENSDREPLCVSGIAFCNPPATNIQQRINKILQDEAREKAKQDAADKAAADEASGKAAYDRALDRLANEDGFEFWYCTEIEYDNPYLKDNGLETIVKIYQDGGRNAVEQLLGVSEDNLV